MESGSTHREKFEESRPVEQSASSPPSSSNFDLPVDPHATSLSPPMPGPLHVNSDYQIEIPAPSSEGYHSLIRHSATTTFFLDLFLFFGCGIGTSICYIATLSSLVYFKLLYGENSFIYLNLAVFLPLLPISLSQARWDQYYDLQYQSRNTFLTRGIVGFLLGLMGTIPMVNVRGLHGIVFQAALQGTGGAILYGTFNQMASFVGAGNDRKLKTAVSAGVQASALVVLAASIWSGFGVHNASHFPAFVWTIVAIESLCFVFFMYLVLARPMVVAAMSRRDSSLRWDEGIIEEGDEEILREPLMTDVSSPTAELSFSKVYEATSSCCWLLIATLVPSFLVGSWFTRVQTNWMALASWLFYVRIAADFLGRLFTIIVPAQSVSYLRDVCIGRLAIVGLFFLNARRSLPFSEVIADGLSILLVGIIAFLSGYLVTGCYQLAPLSLSAQLREANVAKQASILTVAFATSAVVGLLSSFALVALRV